MQMEVICLAHTDPKLQVPFPGSYFPKSPSTCCGRRAVGQLGDTAGVTLEGPCKDKDKHWAGGAVPIIRRQSSSSKQAPDKEVTTRKSRGAQGRTSICVPHGNPYPPLAPVPSWMTTPRGDRSAVRGEWTRSEHRRRWPSPVTFLGLPAAPSSRKVFLHDSRLPFHFYASPDPQEG